MKLKTLPIGKPAQQTGEARTHLSPYARTEM
jgi:hypothetical protein